MKWPEFSDTLLIEPYQFTPKSKERGPSWTEAAGNVTKSFRDRLCSVPEIN